MRFIVIGGFAALAHGSPFPTQDIDITPEADSDNWTCLSDALTELGARVRVEGIPEGLPFSHDAQSLSGVSVWYLVTEYGDLDISVRPTGTQGYGDLARDAVQVRFEDLTVHIASLADVVRSSRLPTGSKTSGCCRPCANCFPDRTNETNLEAG